MTDNTNNTANESTTKQAKALTVAGDMSSREVFATLADAQQYLEASSNRFTDWADQILVAPALLTDEEGNATGFDPEVYDSGEMEVMVATLKNKGSDKGASTLKAVVVAPIPTLATLLGTDAGTAFVTEIVRKELNHRAVRALRVVEDVTTVADQIPYTVDGYISSSRESSGILESYNELYKTINATLGQARPIWAKMKLNKTELRKALESRAYALEYYVALEDGRDGSLFEAALKLGINAAKRSGIDPTIFERWLNSRNEKALQIEDEDEDELDLDALTESMLAEPEAAPAEPTETAA